MGGKRKKEGRGNRGRRGRKGREGDGMTIMKNSYFRPCAFPLTPKHVTLNDLECPLSVKFCFVPVCLDL